MSKFEFYEKYAELENLKNITLGDSRIESIVNEPETCLGHRKISGKNYHIFYLKSSGFAVYYHGGGVDAMYTSESLGDVLNYVNTIEA